MVRLGLQEMDSSGNEEQRNGASANGAAVNKAANDRTMERKKEIDRVLSASHSFDILGLSAGLHWPVM